MMVGVSQLIKLMRVEEGDRIGRELLQRKRKIDEMRRRDDKMQSLRLRAT